MLYHVPHLYLLTISRDVAISMHWVYIVFTIQFVNDTHDQFSDSEWNWRRASVMGDCVYECGLQRPLREHN